MEAVRVGPNDLKVATVKSNMAGVLNALGRLCDRSANVALHRGANRRSVLNEPKERLMPARRALDHARAVQRVGCP